jgi:hypothetical protein
MLVVGHVASSRQVVKAVTDAQHTRPGVHLKTGSRQGSVLYSQWVQGPAVQGWRMSGHKG